MEILNPKSQVQNDAKKFMEIMEICFARLIEIMEKEID